MGKPLKFTQEVAEKLLQGARDGLHKQVCAWGAGIHPATLENWLAVEEVDTGASELSQFARDFREAEAEAEAQLVRRLRDLGTGEDLAEKGNHAPAVEFLKRRWPKRWGDRAALEHSGPEGGPMQHEVTPADIQAAVADEFGGRVAVEQKDDPGDPTDTE